MPTGAEMIAAERRRQVEAEGWTPDHDDEHEDGEMAMAAACYAAAAAGEPVYVWRKAEVGFFVNDGDRGDRRLMPEGYYDAWPWDEEWDKREKHDRLRRLVIAGALIAAEIDRFQRAG